MSHATLCFLSFNRRNFLPNAVISAVEGAHEPVEVIVHDDGSSDPDLIKYLNDMVGCGMISTLILNPPGHNQGQGVALNRMFGMASGDPIIKLDHDLTFSDGWLAEVRHVLEDQRVGLLGLFRYWHEPVDWRKTAITDVMCREMGIDPPLGHCYHTHICGSAMAIPRRVWQSVGPFAEHYDSFGEDWDYQKRVHERAPAWMNALPDHDLVVNHGFGVGPSTVVVRGADGQLCPAAIHHGAHLVSP